MRTRHTITNNGTRSICVYSLDGNTRVSQRTKAQKQHDYYLGLVRKEMKAKGQTQAKFDRADNALFGGNFEDRLQQIRNINV